MARGVTTFPSGAAALTLTHVWTVAGEAECAVVPGATWAGGQCRSVALANAVELSRDGSGNDNLLCEPGERCLYTPNIGAYQGHGRLVFAGMGGPSGDVALYARATNGR